MSVRGLGVVPGPIPEDSDLPEEFLAAEPAKSSTPEKDKNEVIVKKDSEGRAVAPKKSGGKKYSAKLNTAFDLDTADWAATLPQFVKDILLMFDISGDGQLEKEELRDVGSMVQRLKEACDVEEKGYCTQDEMSESIALIGKLNKQAAQNAGEMEYGYLPEKLKEVFKLWDLDGGGTVSQSELMAAATAWESMKKENRLFKKLLVAAVVIIFILFLGIFCLSLATAELAKEFKNDGDAKMVTRDGEIVQTASSEYTVTEDGSMVPRNNESERRLRCSAGDASACLASEGDAWSTWHARILNADGFNAPPRSLNESESTPEVPPTPQPGLTNAESDPNAIIVIGNDSGNTTEVSPSYLVNGSTGSAPPIPVASGADKASSLGTQQVLYNVPLVPTMGEETLSNIKSIIIQAAPSERIRRLAEEKGAVAKNTHVKLDVYSASSQLGLGSRCGKHVVLNTESGHVFVVDGDVFVSSKFLQLAEIKMVLEDAESVDADYIKLPTGGMLLGVFTAVPSEDTASVCGDAEMPIQPILTDTFLLHEGTWSSSENPTHKVERKVFTSFDRTFVSDTINMKAGVSQRVLVMDHTAGVVTTFETLDGGEKMYCAKFDFPSVPRVALDCKYKAAGMSDTGATAVWACSLPFEAGLPAVVEVGVDLVSGLMKYSKGKGFFGAIDYHSTRMLDVDTFNEELGSLKDYQECWKPPVPLQSAAFMGLTGAGTSTVQSFIPRFDEKDAMQAEGEVEDDDDGDDTAENAPVDESVCPAAACHEYTIDLTSNFVVCKKPYYSESLEVCVTNVTAEWMLTGEPVTTLAEGMELKVVGELASSSHTGADRSLIVDSVMEMELKTTSKLFKVSDFYTEAAGIFKDDDVQVTLPEDTVKMAGVLTSETLELSGMSVSTTEVGIPGSMPVPGLALQYVKGGSIGTMLSIDRKVCCLVPLGPLAVMETCLPESLASFVGEESEPTLRRKLAEAQQEKDMEDEIYRLYHEEDGWTSSKEVYELPPKDTSEHEEALRILKQQKEIRRLEGGGKKKFNAFSSSYDDDDEEDDASLRDSTFARKLAESLGSEEHSERILQGEGVDIDLSFDAPEEVATLSGMISPELAKAQSILAKAKAIKATALVADLTCTPQCEEACSLEMECTGCAGQEYCGMMKSVKEEAAGSWLPLSQIITQIKGEIVSSMDETKQFTAGKALELAIAHLESGNIRNFLGVSGKDKMLSTAELLIDAEFKIDSWKSGEVEALKLVKYLVTRQVVFNTGTVPPTSFELPTFGAGFGPIPEDYWKIILGHSLINSVETSNSRSIVNELVKSISGSGVSMMITGCGPERPESPLRMLQNSTVDLAESTEVATRRAQEDESTEAATPVTCTCTVALENVKDARIEFGGVVPLDISLLELGFMATKDEDGTGSIALLDKGPSYTVVSKDGVALDFTMVDDEEYNKEEDSDFILTPNSNPPPKLEEIMKSTADLPPWFGLPGAQVMELRWQTNNDNSTVLIKFENMEKVNDFNHPLVEAYQLFGDIVCTDSPGLSEYETVIDKISLDLKYADIAHSVELPVDGESESDVKFPEMSIFLGVEEGTTMFRKVMANALDSIGIGKKIRETAYATGMTFDFDVSKPQVYPKSAVIEQVQLVIRRQVLTPLDKQKLITATEDDQTKAAGSTVLMDELKLTFDLNADGTISTVADIVGDESQVRNLLVPGLLIPVASSLLAGYPGGGTFASGTASGLDIPTAAVLDTLSRRVAIALCLDPAVHQFQAKKVFASVPLFNAALEKSDMERRLQEKPSSELHSRRLQEALDTRERRLKEYPETYPRGLQEDAAYVVIALQEVSHKISADGMTIPLFGDLEGYYETITIKIPADVFYDRPPASSLNGGGDAVFDHPMVEYIAMQPVYSFPKLGTGWWPFATKDGGHTDGLGRRLAAGPGSEAILVGGSAAAECPNLMLRADGKPLLWSSALLRRRVGKVLFTELKPKALPADAKIDFNDDLAWATMYLNIPRMANEAAGEEKKTLSVQLTMSAGTAQFIEEPFSDASRRLQAFALAGDSNASVAEVKEEKSTGASGICGDDTMCPCLAPAENKRRLQAGTTCPCDCIPTPKSDITAKHSDPMGCDDPWANKTESDPNVLDFPGNVGITAPFMDSTEALLEGSDALLLTNMEHADVKRHKIECQANAQQARRLAFKEVIHTRRLEATDNGRRLAATVPLELKPPLIDATCEANDCQNFDSEDKCNKAAVDLGKNFPNGATIIRNGQEKNTAPPGCLIKTIKAYSGMETHLMWNDNLASTGITGNNDAGGEYRSICECNQGKYPLPVLLEGIETMDGSDFGCSNEGEAMPHLGDGELLLDDLLNATVRCHHSGECKGDEVNGLAKKYFDDKCATVKDAKADPTMGDPGNWGGIIWDTKQTGQTQCYEVTASGDKMKKMGITGTYKFIAHNYKKSGQYEFVSQELKASKVPLGDFSSKLTFLKGRIMGSTRNSFGQGNYPLNFIGYDKLDSLIFAANTDINPLFKGILKGFKLPLVPGMSQIKGDWSFDINDALKFENAYVNVGWNVGPGKLWPGLFTVSPTMFVTIGTMKPSYDGAVLSKTYSTGARTNQWGIIRLPHGCGALAMSYLGASTGNLKFTLGVPPGYVLKQDFEFVKESIARMPISLLGQVVLKVDKATLGTVSDFEIELRVSYEHETGEMELGGMTNTPVMWNIEPLGTTLEFHARAQYKGPVAGFKKEDVILRFKGAGFGLAPFKIGAAPPPNLFVYGDFEGTYAGGKDGVNWEVAAGVENMQIDGLLKSASMKFTYSKTDGMKVEGSATVEIDLKGVGKPPKMAVVLKYTKEEGLKVLGTTNVQIAPATWGLPMATIEFSYEAKRTPRIIASAEITGTIKVEAMFPGAPTGIQITVFASTKKEFYVEGKTQVTLPASLGSKKVDITVKIDKDGGLTAVGETKSFNYKLVDFDSSLNQAGLADIVILDVVLMASAPWKKNKPVDTCKNTVSDAECNDHMLGEYRRRYYGSRRRRRRRRRRWDKVDNLCNGNSIYNLWYRRRRRYYITWMKSICPLLCGTCKPMKKKHFGPKAAIWLQAQMGGKDSIVEGLAVFTGSGICLVLGANPDAIDPVLKTIGLSADKLEKQTIALCNDPSVLDDLALPEVSAVDKPAAPPAGVSDKSPHCKLWAGRGECKRNAGYMLRMCLKSCKDLKRKGKKQMTPKEYAKTMPKITIKGFSITVPIQIKDGSTAANLLKACNMPLKKFEFSLGYDFQDKAGIMKVTLGTMTWKNQGAVEEATFDLAFEVEFGKKRRLDEIDLNQPTNELQPVHERRLKMGTPQVSASLMLKIRVDQESGKLLWFKGTIDAGPLAVVGSLELYSPSVIRLIAKRIGLISRKTKPIKLAFGWAAAQGLTMEAQANVILSSDKDVPLAVFNTATYWAGDAYWNACMWNSQCVAVDFIIALSYDPVTQRVGVDRVQLRLAGELTFIVLLQSVLGVTLPSAMNGACAKWMGVLHLFSLDYNPGAMSVHAAGAFTRFGIAFMFGFGVGLSGGGFYIDLRLAVSKGCLGIGGSTAYCTGVALDTVGWAAYNEWDGIVKKIKSYGWPKPEDRWSTNLLPAQLRSKYGMGSYAKFVLTHKGITLDINVKARPSVSFIDLRSVLPVLHFRISYISGYLKVDLKIKVWIIYINLNFGMFMGSASWSGGRLVVRPPSFGYFKFAIDCSSAGGSLMGAIRNHAKKTWGWFWFWLADSVFNIFSWIDFKWFKFAFTTTYASLDLNFRFLGITIHLALHFDFVKARNALLGNYGDVASSSSSSMEKHEVDECDVDKDKGWYGHSHDYKYVYSTWWAWAYKYGHDSTCGRYYRRHRHCGRSFWRCGVSTGWWWSRNKYCCWTSTTSHYHGCYYKYKRWGSHAELKHYKYKVTYGKCAPWYASGQRLKYLTSRMSYKNYIMQSEYYCGDRWPNKWHGGGCNHNCQCR